MKIKLIDLLREIINEGVTRRKDGKLSLNTANTYNDLLNTNIKGSTIRGGNIVYYTFEYNPKYENGKEVKLAADDIKNLNNINENELYKLTLQSIKSIFENFTPDVVYHLGSSKGLSSFIAKVIGDNYPDIEISSLDKKEFPSWKDMLVDDYEKRITSPELLFHVEKIAKLMWEKEEKKIKSSGYDSKIRIYFKPKYELEKILARKEKLSQEKILFVDDNTQTGIDFSHIKQAIPKAKKVVFYASIILPKEGASDTETSRAVRRTFCLKNTDPKYFKPVRDSQNNKSLLVLSSHPEILSLKKGLKINDAPEKINGQTYFRFKKGTEIESVEDIPRCEQ
jgi:hypothetical protein